MSHFTVIVFGEKPEEQLAPYHEQDETYFVFHDKTEEYRKQYETESVEMIVVEDGSLVFSWDKRFQVPGRFGFDFAEPPDRYPRRQVPFKERYDTLESFIEKWHLDSRNPETGKYGYFHNPNGKWDWCSLGGRWSGYFRVSPNPFFPQDIKIGEPGVYNNVAAPKTADQLRRCDVDLKFMQEQAKKKALNFYGKLVAAVSTLTDIAKQYSWDEAREWAGEDHLDQARDIYNEQPYIRALKKANLFMPFSEDPILILRKTREQVLEEAASSAITPFAAVKDGVWYEKAEKLSWAVTTEPRENWNREFLEMFDSAPDETLLSLYDCHV